MEEDSKNVRWDSRNNDYLHRRRNFQQLNTRKRLTFAQWHSLNALKKDALNKAEKQS
jgi:hypothetical protein